MDITDPRRRHSTLALTHGAVKPWHVVFLIVVSWMVGIVGGTKATQSLDGSIHAELEWMAKEAILSSIVLAFTIVVPEFRRSLSALFARPASTPSPADLAVAYALMLAWGFGPYLIAFCLPVLLLRPDAYQILYFVSAVPAFEPKYVLYFVGAVLISPVGEELVFRGYLLNLWMTRLGVWPAVILSTVVFGLPHLERAIFAMPLGLICALVYLRYDSLWPGIVLHAAYNLLCMPWFLGGFFYVKQKSSIGDFSSWIPEAVISLLFIPLFVLFWRRFKPA